MAKKLKFIFVSGGVLSGVGKGITTASISLILKSKGLIVSPFKCDPYINVDAGTMNPTEHGEVFVTDDGAETDQDLGHYERFLDVNLSGANITTMGQVFQKVIEKERNLEYEGKCVEVVPHIPEEIIRRIKVAALKMNADLAIVEIGGTVGEYQNILFLEAARILKFRYPEDVIHIHVGYLPTPKSLGEMKSKPVQQSVRQLNSVGIQPDFLIGRSECPIDSKRREKLALFCNMNSEDIMTNHDVNSIYEVPLILESQKLGSKILKKLKMKESLKDLKDWSRLVEGIKSEAPVLEIGVVGKYFTTGDFSLEDSYVSVIEATKHSCWAQNVKPKIVWVDSEEIQEKGTKILKRFSGIVVPGGFGARGVEGIIDSIKFARTNKIPFLGLCFGMQLATVEFARNVCKLKGANTLEIDPGGPCPVINIMESQIENLAERIFGGSMRLGAYPCVLNPESKSSKIYRKREVSERHRHRYEFNNTYRETLKKNGLVIAGTSPDNKLVEIIELRNHPFFVGVQFHPEFKSRPLNPHPLFYEFIKMAKKVSG